MKTNRAFVALVACGSLGYAALAEIAFERVTSDGFSSDSFRSFGCSWADYDQDGFEDLLVLNGYEQSNCLYRNNQDGTFSKILLGPVATDLGDSSAGVWADFDNDGDLDLYVTNYDPPNNFFYLNTEGTLSRGLQGPWVDDGTPSVGAAWADVDADGYIDLLVAVAHDGNNLLYLNTRTGTVERVTSGPLVTSGATSLGCEWADYDNDGKPDLYVVNSADGQANSLFHNQGHGVFVKVPDGPQVTDVIESYGAHWGDYDNDGDFDLFVTEMPSANSLYRNDQDGLFVRIEDSTATVSEGNCREPVWADFDNDGYLDLFLTSATGQGNWLYRNDRNGQFELLWQDVVMTDSAHSYGCATSDFDNDGDLDLCVVNGGLEEAAPNFLYRNISAPNKWILVRLVGTASNRSAIGAKLRLKTSIWGEEVWQLRQVSGGVGYLSQDSLRAHFGLGDATQVDTLRIEWPSGIVQELTDIPANQILTVTEPPRLIPQGAGGFQIQSWINQSFGVEASTDLLNWGTVATVTNETGTLVFQDPEVDQHNCRYYRVQAK